VLSVLLRYTDSDYPFGIFALFYCKLGLENERRLKYNIILVAESHNEKVCVSGRSTIISLFSCKDIHFRSFTYLPAFLSYLNYYFSVPVNVYCIDGMTIIGDNTETIEQIRQIPVKHTVIYFSRRISIVRGNIKSGIGSVNTKICFC
jgi:hypothetical protein